jgi:hypothetical protein
MVGTGNDFVPGLDFDINGTLFGSRGGSNGHLEDLVTINTTTGVQTAIAGATTNISDIVFGSDGILYGGGNNGDLFSIDPVTGQKTFLFDTNFNISGLTAQRIAVPEPSTLGLIGLGLLGLGAMKWRRHS